MMSNVSKRIESERDPMVRSLIEMCRIPAFHPSSGGDGESEKSKYLEKLVRKMGFECKVHNAKDPRVSSGVRPNVVVVYDNLGKAVKKKRVWGIAHSDVVPPGDLARWTKPPFEPWVKGGLVYGRGVEDNGQAVVSMLYALKALKDENVPNVNAGVALVADEETGSEKGITCLIDKGVFKKNDEIMVSDWGTPEGDKIEVAEKSILWLKFNVEGKQAHGSRPEQGRNAHRAGARLLCRIDDRLHERFGARNKVFEPPISTFEPTKKEANVPNINTVPSVDVFYFDCRVLPRYNPDDVISIVMKEARSVKRDMGVNVKLEVVQKERSPPTPENSAIVRKVRRAVKEVVGIETKLVGIGGGTCAAHFRKRGFQVAVWQTVEGKAHSVNEYMKIDNMVQDAKVFAHLFGQQ